MPTTSILLLASCVMDGRVVSNFIVQALLGSRSRIVHRPQDDPRQRRNARAKETRGRMAMFSQTISENISLALREFHLSLVNFIHSDEVIVKKRILVVGSIRDA